MSFTDLMLDLIPVILKCHALFQLLKLIPSVTGMVVLPDPDLDPPLIIPSSTTTAEKSLAQGHKHISVRRYATRRTRRAQGFLKGDLVLVLVAARKEVRGT